MCCQAWITRPIFTADTPRFVCVLAVFPPISIFLPTALAPNKRSQVPVKDFNARAADADETVPFTGDGSGSFVLQRNIESSNMVFVRVVRADAP